MHHMMAPRLRLCLPVFAALLLACKVTTSSSPGDDAKPDGAGSGEAKPDGPGDGGDGDGGASGPGDITAPDEADGGDGDGAMTGKKVGGCEDGEHQIGDEWKVDCNTCNCNADGKVVCTRMACNVDQENVPH